MKNPDLNVKILFEMLDCITKDINFYAAPNKGTTILY